MKPAFRSALILLMFFTIHNSYGQYGLQLGPLIPTGNYFPYVLKPGAGAELLVQHGEIDSRFRFGGSFGYYVFQPTQDTFQTYAVGGLPTQLLPGYEVIQSYSILVIGARSDFKILNTDAKLSPDVGLDFHFHIFDISEVDYAETLVSSSSVNDYYLDYAFTLRIGAQYQLSDNWLLSVGLGRNMGFGGVYPAIAFWQPYINIIYYPD